MNSANTTPDIFFAIVSEQFSVSRETSDKLYDYYELLRKWQTRVNLVGPDTVDDAVRRHFLDSLQLAPHLPSPGSRIVDIGTGAGFPGMALAINGYHDCHLIDSDQKKITFLREVARITQTPVHLYASRIESITIGNVDCIVSRACAPLAKLFSYAEHFISRGTICLFHKGKNYSTDSDDAKQQWDFEVTTVPSIVDAESVILKIEHLRKRGL